MAEKEMGPDGVAANRPSGDVTISGTAEYLIANSPAPSDKAKKVYAVAYPVDHFVMADMPVITATGTPLTDDQFKKLEPVAEASGVKIVEVP